MQLFSLSAQDSPAVPALYVFGDSTIDAGNNNNLKTNAKANYPFYGIDFNNTPTGRFTNGMTTADFIATFLGLPLPPAYLNLSETARNKVTTGLNYGSACGVLPDTGSTEGSCLSLDKQIDLFESSIKNVVPAENMELHLAKSIIFISIGSNDYILNYFKNLSSTSTLSPAGFADFLSNEHIKRLQRLYTIGARKFVVNGIGLIGCLPVVMMTVKHEGDCVEFMNAAVELYNNQLVSKLQKLQPELRNAIFCYSNCFKVFQDLRAMPQKYGITDVRNPCFVSHLPVCPVRDSHLFFDIAHPSQLPYKIFATLCFNDSSICTPMNIKQLASAN